MNQYDEVEVLMDQFESAMDECAEDVHNTTQLWIKIAKSSSTNAEITGRILL